MHQAGCCVLARRCATQPASRAECHRRDWCTLWQAENDSLQRVYGISFPDKKRMAEWTVRPRCALRACVLPTAQWARLWLQLRMEEAKKRDHRILGVKQVRKTTCLPVADP